jgi:hypothetical protein
MATHRKLAAIFSADAAGYSRLMADGEAGTNSIRAPNPHAARRADPDLGLIDGLP